MSTLGRLHVITDYHFQQRFSHAELAQLAIDGGADTIQFRQKRAGIRRRLVAAREAADVCRRAGVPMIVDDDITVALAVDAEGVHLGQRDFPVDEARRLLGARRLIGATATTVRQAVRAVRAGADYIGFGPVFSTFSKANPASVKGVEGLRRVCNQVDVPVIAIGGITRRRVADVLAAGAYGVAVLSAVTLAADPARGAAELRRALEQAST